MTGLRGEEARFLAILLAIALTGCGGLLPDPPKRQLYRLEPALTSPAARLPQVAVQLLVAVPLAPSGLDTSRIALSRTPLSLDYFADSEWADRAPLLVQSALIDAFEKSRAVGAVARDSAAFRADFVLETTIRDFQAAYAEWAAARFRRAQRKAGQDPRTQDRRANHPEPRGGGGCERCPRRRARLRRSPRRRRRRPRRLDRYQSRLVPAPRIATLTDTFRSRILKGSGR
jgi:ABC-type uncharacterized transport system auxiliary subunit